jgi:phosphinothricin acetyltransferase
MILWQNEAGTIIRPAHEDDAWAIAAIHDHYVNETLATLDKHGKSPSLWEDDINMGPPFFVAEHDGKVLGFVTYAGPYCSGEGDRPSAEVILYLAEEARGQGLGRGLMQVLEKAALRKGGEVMTASISSANLEAIAFYAALGYGETGRQPRVARKFGQRLDLVLMQKAL